MVDIDSVRSAFPFFKNNLGSIYFDSAATSLKPKSVIDTVMNYYEKDSYNIGRGSYAPAIRLAGRVNRSREKIARFIGADVKDIYFMGSASEISYQLAQMTVCRLEDGDEIVTCSDDHRSTVRPWIDMTNYNVDKKVTSVQFSTDRFGEYNKAELYSKLSNRTKVVVLTHIHNVYGMNMELEKIVPEIRSRCPAMIVVDASQSISHVPIDVGELDVDAVYFSGHKMFAETGVGVLWINEEFRDKLANSKNKDDRWPFEKGTLDIPAILSIGAAVDFMNDLGMENISSRVLNLTQYLIGELKSVKQVEFSKGPAVCSCYIGYGIVSFRIEGIDSNDMSDALSNERIYVRSGSQCQYNSESDSLRVSLHFYNTKSEIDRFVGSISNILSQPI